MSEACPAIFEGAFEHDNRRIRVDILRHVREGKWALYEVKSSTSIHEEHLDDAAFQADVLRQSGVNLSSVSIVHICNKYRRGLGGIDVNKLFQIVDVSERLNVQSKNMKLNLASMADILGNTEPPKVAPGLHCWQPYACEFLDQCTKTVPKDWIVNFPRVTQAQIDELSAIGVSSIGDIPDNVTLRSLQDTIRAVHRTGVPFISSSIQESLRPFGPPAFYLDFESMMPGIPLYPETSPYQHIPFLFSLHRDQGGSLSHSEYIAPPGPDPRRAVAEELIRQTSLANDPIIVYSHYEKRILNELASALPELAPDLKKIIDRLQDLLMVVRRTIYLPAFNGSFSIKDVGPALSDVKYEDLDIGDGSAAAAAYQQLVETPDMLSATKEKSLSDLRTYCKRDTRAMVKVHRALIKMADTQISSIATRR
jgi:predicted RecB family nuclease